MFKSVWILGLLLSVINKFSLYHPLFLVEAKLSYGMIPYFCASCKLKHSIKNLF